MKEKNNKKIISYGERAAWITVAIVLAIVILIGGIFLGPLLSRSLSYAIPVPIDWVFPEYSIEIEDVNYIDYKYIDGGTSSEMIVLGEESTVKYLNKLSNAKVKLNWVQAIRNKINHFEYDESNSTMLITFHMKDGSDVKLYLSMSGDPSFQRINNTDYYNNWYSTHLYP